jgi:hypothetical protein
VSRILVIKLAALGDVVQAFGPFAAIRAHHPGARITLLTTPPFAPLLARAPWFDEVWSEGRPGWTDPAALWRLARQLRHAAFDRVYDLQTSGRSSRYRWLVGRGAEWSGIAPGASHPHADPRATPCTRWSGSAGSWRRRASRRFRHRRGLARCRRCRASPCRRASALLVPGASAQRPGKRWPTERFAALAARLGMPCAVVGGPPSAAWPPPSPARWTSPARLRWWSWPRSRAGQALCVGNDTGPTHLAAATWHADDRHLRAGQRSCPVRAARRGRHGAARRTHRRRFGGSGAVGGPFRAEHVAAARPVLPDQPGRFQQSLQRAGSAEIAAAQGLARSLAHHLAEGGQVQRPGRLRHDLAHRGKDVGWRIPRPKRCAQPSRAASRSRPITSSAAERTMGPSSGCATSRVRRSAARRRSSSGTKSASEESKVNSS